MEASIEQQELQKAPVEADHSAATSSQGEGIPELPDKHKRQGSRVNYQEIGDRDEDFEAMLAAEERHYHAAKRQRMEAKGSTQGNPFLGMDQVEQETAWAMDFSATAIVEEEEDLIPSNASEFEYVKTLRGLGDKEPDLLPHYPRGIQLQMRNYVLAKWRAQADSYLSEEEAAESLEGSQRGYAQVAWRFLDSLGLINFGVAKDILTQGTGKRKSGRTVIVVGAGLAGLAAARQLQRKGCRVIILEGHSRPGGRVYTKKLKVGGHEAVADLGGSILTGIDGNPLAVLAKQLRIPMHEIEQTQVPLYLEDGALPAKELDEEVEQDYNKVLDSCSNFRDGLGELADNISLGVPLRQFWSEMCSLREASSASRGDLSSAAEQDRETRQRFFDWHIANLEFANAASVNDLSVRSWDQDDPHELPGAHCFLPGGNIRLVAAMSEGLKIVYNARVQQVSYAKEGVSVRTATHSFQGDAVLVTVPLGVLKHRDIKFNPPLSPRKLGAIQRIGFGLLNKIILLFPYNFWGNKDMFGRLPELSQQRGEGYLFYSYAHLSGAAVLAGLISGDAAREFEKCSVEESTRKVLAMLRGIFQAKGISVPAPLQVCCTRWGKDELARGSYSSMAVGAQGGEDYDILGESLGGRVFFAGESTTRKYPATMHGAFYSGIREAANMVATLDKAEVEARLANQHKAEHSSVSELPALDLKALKQAAEVWSNLAIIDKIFKNPSHPPDKQFGCFSAILAPQGSEFDGRALLQVDFAAAKGKSAAKGTPDVVVSISTQDLYRLQDVHGSNEARLAYLASLQSLKLVNRATLSKRDLQMLQAILKDREAQQHVKLASGELISAYGSLPIPNYIQNTQPADSGLQTAVGGRTSKSVQPPQLAGSRYAAFATTSHRPMAGKSFKAQQYALPRALPREY